MITAAIMIMADIEEQAKQYSNFRALVLTSIMTAFGFVLALFWDDAVKSTIDLVVKSGDTLTAKYEAAIFATLIVVIIMYIILRWNRLTEKKISEIKMKNAQEIKKLEEKIELLKKKKGRISGDS